MLKKMINGHNIELFDNIEQLPIDRFQAFNLALLIDSGIGGNVENITNHYSTLLKFITEDKKEEAQKELENYYNNLYFIINKINPKHNAFAVLIHKIDGIERIDISENGIKETLQILERTTPISFVNKTLETIKKKLYSELEMFFGGLFGSSEEKEYWTAVHQRTIFLLKKIQGIDIESELKKIDTYLLSFLTPKNFTGTTGIEISYKNQFEEICAVIENHFKITAKGLTVFEFYKRLDFIKKSLKDKK